VAVIEVGLELVDRREVSFECFRAHGAGAERDLPVLEGL
jgi:hypothetical protein